MTIGKKISVFYALPAALALVIGGVAVVDLALMNQTITKLATDSLPGTYSIGRLSGIAKDIRGGIRGHITAEQRADKLKADADLAALNNSLRKELSAYEKTITTPRDRELFSVVAGKFDELQRCMEHIRPLSMAGQMEDAMQLFRSNAMPAYLQVQRAIEDVYAFKQTNGDRNAAEAVSMARSDGRTLWLLLGVAGVCCGFLGWYIVRDIHRTLRPMVSELGAAATELGAATRHIGASSNSLAQGASQQAASLEETSAASEEIYSMAGQNLGKTQEAARLMAETMAASADAGNELEQVMTLMHEMDDSSSKVAAIIKVIDEIAFQTNILALNAAVEAARAGQAGMGFAVVADEVRNLAHRSSQAARDTAVVIQESISKSKRGRAEIDRMLEAVRKMRDSAKQVKALVDEVNTASGEQARGIEEISKSISQMDQITQKTAASAEETASVGQQMNSHARSLGLAIERLHQMAGAGRVSA
ncbi:MAG: methyl-accepting chemotaxis protein [Bryobacteraceae bacterium]